jgi:elongation factor G
VVPEKVRNIALVGHGGSGKTTLGEAMLFAGGATKRMGSVTGGTTVFDHEPEEIDRGISLSLAVATVDWKGTRVNIIDSPGATEFSGDHSSTTSRNA